MLGGTPNEIFTNEQLIDQLTRARARAMMSRTVNGNEGMDSEGESSRGSFVYRAPITRGIYPPSICFLRVWRKSIYTA